jgi:hypothetical protein
MSSKSKPSDTPAGPKSAGRAALGAAKKAVEGNKGKPLPVQVVLEHGRSRHLGWIAFCGVVGLLFVLKLGSIGQGVGALLLLIALLQTISAVRTLLHKPGTFEVSEDKISVPTGLCKGEHLTLSETQLEHAFFLRRAVPWSKAGPILVIEAEGKAYTFPRDWFASDSDQRRVAMALNHRIQNKTPA